MIQSEEWCIHYRENGQSVHNDRDILVFGTQERMQARFWEIAQEPDVPFVELFNAYQDSATWTFQVTQDTVVNQRSSVPGLFARTHTYRTLQEVSSDEGEK